MPEPGLADGPPGGPSWLSGPDHHEWLAAEERRLVGFYEAHALDDRIGYAPLDAEGNPETGADRELWLTCRMIHCFALEHLRGRPGAAAVAAHGLRALNEWFADGEHGGWFAAVAPDGTAADTTKSAYGHAFVILAGASAAQAGLPGGAALLAEALRVVDERFWRPDEAAVVDACTREWAVTEPDYRGQNANMHLAEAYMAASEALADDRHAVRAMRIAERIIDRAARERHWRVPEHFDATWTVVPDYNADAPADRFRPFGSLVGHWFEWSRLLLQLDALLPGRAPWAVEAARELFAAAVADGWDRDRGGLGYSVDFEGRPVDPTRMHWVLAEAIGAAAGLAAATGEAGYERWYRAFWDCVATRHLDRRGGGWWHELDADGAPKGDTWAGKPDLYHALQATLYARSRPGAGLVAAAREGRRP
ncbi:AGE family epimerase/isomerase [Glycomyces sp. NRRL B-16210]|uniref:AGE family epimerase/isomerase n=1 Tax=Glycomyces sp. NRRL B-16210 TaxID=1463821 RepID=UPI00068DF19C|nr:AGE family epimerase/isomerase [Glycomyces sp. NRRL B-16210]